MARRSLARLAAAALCLLVAAGALADAPRHSLLRYWIDTPADQAWIDANAGRLDIAGGLRGDHYDLVVIREEAANYLSRGSRVEVIHENLESFYAARLGERGDFGVWHTYDEAIAWMDSLHMLYPEVVSARWSIGQSIEGRDLWCYRVSDNPEVDEDEPEILFDGMHHAREIMASEIDLMLTEHLAQAYQDNDPDIRWLLQNREVYMVPIVNPDGVVYNEQTDPNGGGMWRKNRRNNGDGTWGVDPNRNYPFHWGEPGCSHYTSEETYCGPSAGSEPEVQAMMAFINAHDFVVRQSWHSCAGMTLYPWGYTTANSPDEDLFREMAAEMVKFNGYAPGQPGDILYIVSGGSFDWDYGETTDHDKIISFTNELGSSSDGFWPPASRRQPIFEDNIWPSVYLIQMAGVLRGVTFDHAPLPFTAQVAGSYDLTCVPAGYEGTAIDPSTVVCRYRVGGGFFTELPLAPTGTPGEYGGAIPAQAAGAVVEYYLEAADVLGNMGTSPRLAPNDLYTFEVGQSFAHDMEAPRGWTSGAAGDDADTGLWVRVEPVGTDAQPGEDHSPDGTYCWITGQHVAGQSVGYSDVDGGKTTLLSPVYDLTGAQTLGVLYWKWYSNDQGNDPNNDWWDVDLSNDGGQTWTSLEHTMTSTNAWVPVTHDLFEHFTDAGLVQLRFVAADEGSGSVVEAAVDDFSIVGTFDATAVEGEVPAGLALRLAPAHPNPFNPRTELTFTLPAAGHARLTIHDARGRLLRTLLDGDLAAGEHNRTWDGRDGAGRPLAGGVYFVRLAAAESVLAGRLVLIK